MSDRHSLPHVMEPPLNFLRCGLIGHDDSYYFLPFFDNESFPPTMTVAELLHAMDKDHTQNCGCAIRVGREAWFLNRRQHDNFQITPYPVSGDRTLAEFDVGLDPIAFHLVVRGRSVGRCLLDIDHSDALPQCQVVEQNDAAVFKLGGPKLSIPDNECSDYVKMCRTEGLVIVDKTRFVLPQFSQPTHKRLAVFRRPAGFGKTTLLSILTTYFDVLCPPAFYSLMDCDRVPAQLDHLDAAGRMMIVHMDFADLHFNSASLEDMYRECNRFLAEVGAKFFGRYTNFLGGEVPDAPHMRGYFAAIAHAYNAGYEVFLAIDNYTAPFKHSCTPWENVVGVHIIGPILEHFAHNRIHRGFITGTDFGYLPFADWERFERLTIDLTHGSELATACGLTSDEVEALGVAADIENLLGDVHSAAASQTRVTPAINIAGHTQPLFSTRDVLALARRRMESQLDQRPVAMNVAVVNIPVRDQNAVDSDDSDLGDSDHTLVDDEIKQSLKSTDDAWASGGLAAAKAADIQPIKVDDDGEVEYVSF
ncbi:hypothetical protein EXIGLDRAFT_769022 [Exidia glandulosa HHB12029]|uniref:AAA-ATPase-like domain-containing protein n=1 Tax=Exidia glandulosa HHB12029 TaxID=1314781 RepID=A0A165HRL4_EXIGL|nr:hypothetical protein EXIGLDRAFT_769022 [Exidia glandulosa HHB12029]